MNRRPTRGDGPIRGVTFDATGTLFRAPRLAEIYARAFRRHGLEASPEEIAPVFRAVWQELSCRTDGSHDRFSAHPGGPRGWWGRFVERVAELLELPAPSRFLVAELYDRFARADAWELYPDTLPALTALHRAGLRLAVVSNWDERLERVLAGLGLSDLLTAVVYSSAVGYEKPDRRIFEAALDRVGLEPAEAVHAGDRPREDVEGAAAVGMAAVLIDRKGTARRPSTPPAPTPVPTPIPTPILAPGPMGTLSPLAGPTTFVVGSLAELAERLVPRPDPT